MGDTWRITFPTDLTRHPHTHTHTHVQRNVCHHLSRGGGAVGGCNILLLSYSELSVDTTHHQLIQKKKKM